MVRFVNLTPHDVIVVGEDGKEILRIPVSGIVARVMTKQEVVDEINGIPVVRTKFGEVIDMPEPQPDTVFIVSTLVAQALAGTRDDIVAPDTSPQGAVRDEQGRIIGVKRFQRW